MTEMMLDSLREELERFLAQPQPLLPPPDWARAVLERAGDDADIAQALRNHEPHAYLLLAALDSDGDDEPEPVPDIVTERQRAYLSLGVRAASGVEPSLLEPLGRTVADERVRRNLAWALPNLPRSQLRLVLAVMQFVRSIEGLIASRRNAEQLVALTPGGVVMPASDGIVEVPIAHLASAMGEYADIGEAAAHALWQAIAEQVIASPAATGFFVRDRRDGMVLLGPPLDSNQDEVDEFGEGAYAAQEDDTADNLEYGSLLEDSAAARALDAAKQSFYDKLTESIAAPRVPASPKTKTREAGSD